MSNQVDIVAILKPAPGKVDRIIELLGGISKIVKERETGTLRYQLHRQTTGDPPTLVVIEKYRDPAAIKEHGTFPQFKDMNRAFKREGLLAEPMQVIVLKPVAGFASRL